MAPDTKMIDPRAGVAGGVPTHAERRSLLWALLLARGLEGSVERDSSGDGQRHAAAVLAAAAAASGLQAGDRLITSHRLLAAHLARGADLSAVAAVRFGERSPAASGWMRGGLAATTPVALAAGVASALRGAAPAGAAVAIVERRWLDLPTTRAAFDLAAEQSWPLVVVAVDPAPGPTDEPAAVDWSNVEALRGAVAAAAHAARGESRPLEVRCTCRPPEAGAGRGRFRVEAPDPLTAFERRLVISGFTRGELAEIRAGAVAELGAALHGRTGGTAATSW